MKNFVQPGDIVTIPAPSGGVVVGNVVVEGSMIGVAETTEAAAADVNLYTKGVFDLTKETADANGVFAVGDPIYWDDTAKDCTILATSNTLIGVAVAVAIQGDTTGRVRLNV